MLILAVGVRPDSRAARELVVGSAAAGVVFKGAPPDSPLVEQAQESGVAVMALAEDMPWGRALTLINTALASAGPTFGDEGGAPVPMGDLFAFANAVAAAVGGAISVEDPRGKVLAYSTLEGQVIDDVRRHGILGRQIPDTPGVREVYRRLWHGEGVIRVDSVSDLKELLPRLAVPVRAGNETLGSLWVVEGDLPLGAEAERTLLQASRLAALHLLRAHAAEDIERGMRAELLRSVLEGTASIPLAASRLGLPADSECSVLAFELVADTEAERELRRGQLVDLIVFYCETFNRQAACVQMANAVYALLPVDTPAQARRLPSLAGSIAETADGRLKFVPRVGIGSVVNLNRAADSRHEADRALQVLGERPDLGPVARIEDVRPQAILLELKELAADSSLGKGPLLALMQQDAARGTFLVPTMRAYLEAFGDVPTAAARLGVHPNTFRYRLRKALQAIDVADADQRLVTELQLRLLDLPS
ncbi:MAG: PucR family transcriptional regulator, partial [Actinomycetota bacterium]